MEFFIYVNGQKQIYEASATKMLVKSELHDRAGIKKVVQELQVGNLKEIHESGGQRFVIEMQNTDKDAMQTANELYETGLFEYAEPNLIHFLRFSTNDPYFSDQWGVKNTG